MARPTTRNSSNGDANALHQIERSNGRPAKRSPKSSKKPLKSNITNAMKLRQTMSQPQELEDDDDGVGDEDESSAADEHGDSAEEPDVEALSGALRSRHTSRLAGTTEETEGTIDDRIAENELQALSGAERLECENDDDYADVEDVSDSEGSDDGEDEHTVLRSAEEDLINEFERNEERRNADNMVVNLNGMGIDDDGDDVIARHLSMPAPIDHLLDFGLDVNMNEDPFYGLANHDNLYRDMWNEAESEIWRMPESIRHRPNIDSNGNQKRVRFEDTRSRQSSTTSEEEEDPSDAFPDLFAASDNPAVKRRLALAVDQDIDILRNDIDDNESFYDFEDEDERLAFELDEDSDSDGESSDYDSDDEGDATDEETREEQIARFVERKKANGSQRPVTPSTPLVADRRISTVASAPSTPRPSTPRSGKGPTSGTFAIDPTRSTMSTDAQGRKVKLLPPSKPKEKDRAFWERAKTVNSTRTNSPAESGYLTFPSAGADDIPLEPFTAKSTLGSMFDGNLDILRNNDISGIAEDLFPAVMVPRQNSFNTTTTDDSDTEAQDVNMQDFLDLQDSDSDSDDPTATALASPHEADMMGTFSSSGLLQHFDQCRGTIGSFRRNQHQAKHISSLPSHPAKRASAHEFNALQKGKRGAANTPITPARKRISQDIGLSSSGVRKSISSPLSARRRHSRGNSLGGINTDLYQTLARNPFE